MKLLRDMTEPELAVLMQSVGDAVRDVLGRESKFVVLCFDDPQVAQYVASCDRGTMVTALREMADRLERRDNVARVEFPG